MGLLGTVMGMIRTFNAIAAAGMGNPTALAGGIAEALITTAAGLRVAIPAMICYRLPARPGRAARRRHGEGGDEAGARRSRGSRACALSRAPARGEQPHEIALARSRGARAERHLARRRGAAAAHLLHAVHQVRGRVAHRAAAAAGEQGAGGRAEARSDRSRRRGFGRVSRQRPDAHQHESRDAVAPPSRKWRAKRATCR